MPWQLPTGQAGPEWGCRAALIGRWLQVAQVPLVTSCQLSSLEYSPQLTIPQQQQQQQQKETGRLPSVLALVL